MIHAWMTDEKDDFYNALLKIKKVVSKPLLTDEMLLKEEAMLLSGASVVPPTTGGIGPSAKPKPGDAGEDSEDEVIDLNTQPAREEPPRPAAKQHSFAKPAPSAQAGELDGENLYDLLGVAPTASLMDIRMKFRQLVVTEHPEKGGDAKKFAKLNKAYGVLSDQEKRRQYDEQLAA